MSFGRGNQSGFGPPVTPQVIKTLLIANGVVYIAQVLVMEVTPLGVVSPDAVWGHFELWRPFTYMWLHSGAMHLAFNMLALWMFGSTLVISTSKPRLCSLC